MKIYYGERDKEFIPSNRTVSVISIGYSIRTTEDALTIRKNGRKDWSLFFVEKGRMIMKDTVILPGQIYIYPPHTPQYYKIYASDNTKYYYIHFTGTEIEEIFNSNKIKSGVTHPSENLSPLFHKILSVYENKTPLALLKAEYLIIKLFCKLSEGDEEFELSDIKKVTDMMKKDIGEKYLPHKYAEIMCLSQSRFNHIFKEKTGVSPKAYFLNLKIKKACTLLEMTDLPIGEITKSVGYTDAFGFSKLFTQRCGLSPLNYRKYHKSQ